MGENCPKKYVPIYMQWSLSVTLSTIFDKTPMPSSSAFAVIGHVACYSLNYSFLWQSKVPLGRLFKSCFGILLFSIYVVCTVICYFGYILKLDARVVLSKYQGFHIMGGN